MKKISIFVPSLNGGGAERVMVTLANAFAERGYCVDLVLSRKAGPFLKDVSSNVNVVDLRSGRVFKSLYPLTRYLFLQRPAVLLSAMGHVNVVALLARWLANAPTRIVVSERSNFSVSSSYSNGFRSRITRILIKWLYPYSDGVIAVSLNVADDLAKCIGLPRSLISVIYNPVVSHEFLAQIHERPDHPWFQPGEPPVILGVGRLSAEKDFSTLIRAFAYLHQQRLVRLVILGEGSLRPKLEALADDLGIAEVVDLPGFQINPFKYMRFASLFVMTSVFEGLPNSLIQAMACGTRVVSSNCPSGPSEILENGRWGRLVSVGDVPSFTQAMAEALDDTSPPNVLVRAADFDVDQSVDGYLRIMLPDEMLRN